MACKEQSRRQAKALDWLHAHAKQAKQARQLSYQAMQSNQLISQSVSTTIKNTLGSMHFHDALQSVSQSLGSPQGNGEPHVLLLVLQGEGRGVLVVNHGGALQRKRRDAEA